MAPSSTTKTPPTLERPMDTKRPYERPELRGRSTMLLTARQMEVLRFVRDFRSDNAIAPTLAEIAGHFSVSKITIHEHLAHLECKGAIRRARGRARSIEIIWDPDNADSPLRKPQLCRPLPVQGTISAGPPAEAIPDIQEFRLDDLIPPHAQIFILQVKGDSMIEDGICNGDLVLVEPRKVARNGETVVAMVNGGDATLKRFYYENGRVRLQPANPEMQPIFPTRMEVQGVVIGLVRKF